jgi:hypothetical protein
MGRRGLTLVVLAAGIGSRFGGPKQIESVGPGGEILLDYSVFDATRAGFTRIVFVVRDEVEALLRSRLAPLSARCDVEYVRQRSDDLPVGRAAPAGRRRPWGTGHAVWTCRDAVTEAFAVVNADDFYGPSAFDAMAGFLRSTDRSAPPRGALVGYALGATLTPHGTVSRGVCDVDPAGRLVAISERHGIERRGARVGYRDGVAWHALSDGAVASMNFWGFPASIFPLFEREFRRFLEPGPADDDEFRLPTAVGGLLNAQEIEVLVLPTEAVWLGVTYREDLAWVRDEIRQRVATGEYPSPLWGGA